MAGRVRSHSVVVRRGSTGRPTHWGISFQTSAPVNIAGGSKVLVVSTAGLLTNPFTIIRSRGFCSIQTDQVIASENQIGAFGIAKVTSLARAAGVASIPGPQTDATWDGWFVHGSFGERFDFVTGAAFDPMMAHTYPIDSKAMRKVDGGDDDIVFVVENFGTNGFRANFAVRFLIKDA